MLLRKALDEAADLRRQPAQLRPLQNEVDELRRQVAVHAVAAPADVAAAGTAGDVAPGLAADQLEEGGDDDAVYDWQGALSDVEEEDEAAEVAEEKAEADMATHTNLHSCRALLSQ